MAERRTRQAWHFSVQWTQRAWLGPGLVQGSGSPRCRSFKQRFRKCGFDKRCKVDKPDIRWRSLHIRVSGQTTLTTACGEAINVLIFSARVDALPRTKLQKIMGAVAQQKRVIIWRVKCNYLQTMTPATITCFATACTQPQAQMPPHMNLVGPFTFRPYMPSVYRAKMPPFTTSLYPGRA